MWARIISCGSCGACGRRVVHVGVVYGHVGSRGLGELNTLVLLVRIPTLKTPHVSKLCTFSEIYSLFTLEVSSFLLEIISIGLFIGLVFILIGLCIFFELSSFSSSLKDLLLANKSVESAWKECGKSVEAA